MIPDKEKLFKEFEASGERLVRENLAQSLYRTEKQPLAEEWLRQKQDARIEASNQRSEAALARAELRDEEGLSLARDANGRARWANRIALAALVVSLLGAWGEIKLGICWVWSKLSNFLQ